MSKELWRGIHKLQEEMGELAQVLGKLGPFPEGEHPDGERPLKERCEDEIADVFAALGYFIVTNGLDYEKITERRDEKTAKFIEWGLTGIKA